MTEQEAIAIWKDIFSDLGIQHGDVVYLGIDMGKIPLPLYKVPLSRAAIQERRERWCAFLLAVLLDAVGEDGTILVPTFSYAYARYGTTYVHETSPSETGPMTEYIRTRSNAIRSLHPLQSVSGIGQHATAILNHVGRASYGIRSPFMRMDDYDTKFLCLGCTVVESVTYYHHLEQLYGVNHMYNKVFNTPVYFQGKILTGPWLGCVRYLGVNIEANITAVETQLKEHGLLKKSQYKSGPLLCVGVHDFKRIALAMLDEDPCCGLIQPIEIHIDSPGASEQMSMRKNAYFTLIEK